jgi:dnd system-associated protein 4
MSIYVNNQFRVKRSAIQQEMMKKLVDAGVFEQYKDILMISAIIGYQNNQFIPIEKRASDGVLMQFFSPVDLDIIDLLAYSRAKEQSILYKDEKYDIFSAYANGGFPWLVDKLGISEDEKIDEETKRKLIKRYYKLLLSNGFVVSLDDLDKQLAI